MKSFLLIFVVFVGCHGQGFQGYYYPRPSIQLQAVPVQTVYRTQTLTRSIQYPVYQTLTHTVQYPVYQTLTQTVQYPVYFTSTVVDIRYITAHSTLIQSVTQYQTRTDTLVIRPSPVTQYSTIVNTATVTKTVVSSVQDDSRPTNAYLPPVPQVDDEARPPPTNAYLPPFSGNARSSSSGILSSDFGSSSGSSGSSVRTSPFGKQPVTLNLGALPPV
ncbi:uncharacterized protein LOC134215448 [Armigeres subalbatus]|uniref:uncharacterized protein LOC134215448 n=1 Tax=Armigeres subalbatus TaxID=124917 RepID=UPI002ED0CD97